MKALLVLDMQKGLLEQKNFDTEKQLIHDTIQLFKENHEPIIFLKHCDRNKESSLYVGSDRNEIDEEYAHYADYIIEKTTPSAFVRTNLDELLRKKQIEHVVVVGFNTEYCCLFTSIAAFERGYKVTLIEDATGTVNDANTYEMHGLHIKDFVGSILNWSNVIEVLYYDGYVDTYCKEEV